MGALIATCKIVELNPDRAALHGILDENEYVVGFNVKVLDQVYYD
jgi:hypothetical protein